MHPYKRPPAQQQPDVKLPSPSEVNDAVQRALPLVDELFASRHMLVDPADADRVNPVRFLIECALCHGKFMNEMGIIGDSEFSLLRDTLTKHIALHKAGGDPYAFDVDDADWSFGDDDDGYATDVTTTDARLFSGLPHAEKFNSELLGKCTHKRLPRSVDVVRRVRCPRLPDTIGGRVGHAGRRCGWCVDADRCGARRLRESRLRGKVTRRSC